MILNTELADRSKDICSIIYGLKINLNKETLETKIPRVDKQHEELLDLIICLPQISNVPNIDENKVKSVLNNLVTYSLEHFSYEEALMQKTSYPDLDRHKSRHKIFNIKLSQFLDEFNGNVDRHRYVLRLSEWLVEWFFFEMLEDDKKMVAFLRFKKKEKLWLYTAVGCFCFCEIVFIFIMVFFIKT